VREKIEIEDKNSNSNQFIAIKRNPCHKTQCSLSSRIVGRLGKEMVDYIADYLENIRDRRVFPQVQPGYMRHLLPESAPTDGEDWPSIFSDIERVIMPGVTHWQSPHMHAYFPALNSFPSLLGDMLADAINCIGFTWVSKTDSLLVQRRFQLCLLNRLRRQRAPSWRLSP
jgi:hypothetical protein